MKTFQQTFTVTIASPGVFTCADHNLNLGDVVILETTGALPTGLSTKTEYIVNRYGYTSSTFQLTNYDSADGDSINTSGSQSGTQTFLKVSHPRIMIPLTSFR